MILCKDQASYDALMVLCDEFPDSIGNVREQARVIQPQELVDFLDPDHISDKPVMLVDLSVVAKLRAHELLHQRIIEEHDRDSAYKALRLDLSKEESMISLTDRIEVVMEKARTLPGSVARKLQNYLESKADDKARVVVSMEMIVELERITGIERPSRKVAIIGGMPIRAGGSALQGIVTKMITDHTRTLIDESPFAHFAEPRREGHEVSKKGRRDVVVSKKGNAYPLPKGQRGMPRVGRTRGR